MVPSSLKLVIVFASTVVAFKRPLAGSCQECVGNGQYYQIGECLDSCMIADVGCYKDLKGCATYARLQATRKVCPKLTCKECVEAESCGFFKHDGVCEMVEDSAFMLGPETLVQNAKECPEVKDVVGEIEGEAPTEVMEPACICPEIYSPVCVNGVTYQNECLAECKGVADVAVAGECSPKIVTQVEGPIEDKSCICMMMMDPVCANGVTYSNKCLAECKGVADVAVAGECAPSPEIGIQVEEEIPEIEPNCICPLTYLPVCGADGHEYSNPCAANCANMKFTKGKCSGEKGSGEKGFDCWTKEVWSTDKANWCCKYKNQCEQRKCSQVRCANPKCNKNQQSFKPVGSCCSACKDVPEVSIYVVKDGGENSGPNNGVETPPNMFLKPQVEQELPLLPNNHSSNTKLNPCNPNCKTCKPKNSEICLSCNEDDVLAKGKGFGQCVKKLQCTNDKIAFGDFKGKPCKCESEGGNCQSCMRTAAGETCISSLVSIIDSSLIPIIDSRCQKGFYNLDGTCVKSCPSTHASVVFGPAGRQCALPFTCSKGKRVGQGKTKCKCTTPANKKHHCHSCEFKAGGAGEVCTRCNKGQFLNPVTNQCQRTCAGAGNGTIPYIVGSYGGQCRQPFNCKRGKDEEGNKCKCPKSVGSRKCIECAWGADKPMCLRCGANKFLQNNRCVKACAESKTPTGMDSKVGRECI